MKYKLLLLAVIAIVLVMSGCVSNLSGSPSGTPKFTALKANNTSVMVMLLDMDGAKNVTGLYVDSPAIASPVVFNNSTAVPVGKQITITDPALAGKVNISAFSLVDGNWTQVLNGSL